jgi:hypothetical protein
MMAEPKYKVDTKGKLTKVADDLQKVLGVRGSPGKPSPRPVGAPPKKP